mgnify:FL=1
MTDTETKAHLLKWCDKPREAWSRFSWPTDPCGLAQHNKFVAHRNARWPGGTRKEWVAFVREYALLLEVQP